MIEKCMVVIPSRERASWLAHRRHSTLNFMSAIPQAELWVREDDSQLRMYIDYAASRGVKLVKYDCKDIHGAAQTYDTLIDVAIKKGHDRLIILDDDLKFTMHNPVLGAVPEFSLVNGEQLRTLLDHSLHLVSAHLPILSVTPIMARTQPSIIAFCKPMMMAYVLYLPHFREHLEHRFWGGHQIEARCDLNLSLKLLTEGYLTAFMNTLFVPDNVNNPGGCSVYRDIECEQRSVVYLRVHYPDFVKTRQKRGWVGDTSVVREAPIIVWKRAFNESLFFKRFNMTGVEFANELVEYYERKYADFIKEVRSATS